MVEKKPNLAWCVVKEMAKMPFENLVDLMKWLVVGLIRFIMAIPSILYYCGAELVKWLKKLSLADIICLLFIIQITATAIYLSNGIVYGIPLDKRMMVTQYNDGTSNSTDITIAMLVVISLIVWFVLAFIEVCIVCYAYDWIYEPWHTAALNRCLLRYESLKRN